MRRLLVHPDHPLERLHGEDPPHRIVGQIEGREGHRLRNGEVDAGQEAVARIEADDLRLPVQGKEELVRRAGDAQWPLDARPVVEHEADGRVEGEGADAKLVFDRKDRNT